MRARRLYGRTLTNNARRDDFAMNLHPALQIKKLYGRGIMSKGSIYRFGVCVKEFGERIGHVRLFGIHFLNWFAWLVIRLGLAIKDSVRNNSISEM
jgi:hypothetical protein